MSVNSGNLVSLVVGENKSLTLFNKAQNKVDNMVNLDSNQKKKFSPNEYIVVEAVHQKMNEMFVSGGNVSAEASNFVKLEIEMKSMFERVIILIE